MGSVSFQDGDGVKRFTDVSGSGTSVDPYVFIFRFPDGYELPVTFPVGLALALRDGTTSSNLLSIDNNGRLTIKMTDEIAATSPSSASGLIGLIRGTWDFLVASVGSVADSSSATGTLQSKIRLLVDTLGITSNASSVSGTLMARMRSLSESFGTSADASSTTGTLMARMRSLVVDTVGVTSDAASVSGTLMARLRSLSESFGTSVDASSTTGTLMARMRSLMVDTVGVTSDGASSTGTLMGRLRIISQAYSSPIVYSRWATVAVDTVSPSSARLVGFTVWNKSNSIRYLQFFNRTTNPPNATSPIISKVISPNERLILNNIDMGSADGILFSTGLAWGFSSTESTFTAASSTEVSIEILWR